MAKITYEHKTDGVYCGGCIFNQRRPSWEDVYCRLFKESKPIYYGDPRKRCQTCIDKFGE